MGAAGRKGGRETADLLGLQLVDDGGLAGVVQAHHKNLCLGGAITERGGQELEEAHEGGRGATKRSKVARLVFTPTRDRAETLEFFKTDGVWRA